jgi:EEF1A N-terminal glycine/lysine methyltransferase
MALTSRLSLKGPPDSTPEDFLAGSLGVIFPDDVTNQHGDAEHSLEYTSPHLPKPLILDVADPTADTDRRLFSHFLWNSSLLLAELVEAGTLRLPEWVAAEKTSLGPPISHFDITGKTTIELGAGTALPSILSVLLGTSRSVITDYPAPVVLQTLQTNVARNTVASLSPSGAVQSEVLIDGHSWGELDQAIATSNKGLFDRIFLSDCLWMPWQHKNLHKSIGWFMRDGQDSRCWVVAGFHTGRDKMRGFFAEDALAAAGLEIEAIWERDCDGKEREWVWDRGVEDITVRKRWLVVGILRRKQ